MGKERSRPRLERKIRHTPGSNVENLEPRQLMTMPPGAVNYYSFDFVQPRTVSPGIGRNYVSHPIGLSDQQLARLDTEGRVLTGKDREGDEWILTIHGPGKLIVSDATPNDGSFDDDLNTIQIVGSDPQRTYVTGQVTATARLIDPPVNTGLSDTNLDILQEQRVGEVLFNHLIANRGVRSIVLNGFTLATTVGPIAGQARNTGPEIYLPGGVKTLAFHNIEVTVDTAGNEIGPDQGFEVVIGDPNTPLRKQQAPTIQIDHIFNTVLNGSSIQQSGGPQIDATVSILVNGDVHALNIGSATARTFRGGLEFYFPRVDVTGRTALRANAVDQLNVTGSARNFTASRGGKPFQPQNGVDTRIALNRTEPFRGGFSGLRRLRRATFGGTADGVGLDVSNGKIGKLRFLRGAGSQTGAPLNPSQYGWNAAQAGYPSEGLTGALVVAQQIGQVEVGPSQLILQTGQDPDFAQAQTQGVTTYYARPGAALVNAAIVSGGSIGEVNQVGLSQQSEIVAGYDYRSFVNGLQPVRTPSHIGSFRQRGDLVDSVVSATYRPNDNIYGNLGDKAGPGAIKGNLYGRTYFTGKQTVLRNFGAGVYARRKIGHLPRGSALPQV